MIRTLLFAPLLLAASVVLAQDAPAAGQASGDAGAKAQQEQAQKDKAKKDQADKNQADKDQAKKEEDAKELSGMSVLGNQEAPKALVIVPWKTSVLGDSLGISPMLDDSRQPVDKDVFMRALNYYEIRSGTTLHDGATAGGRTSSAADRDAAQSATAAPRRKQ